jgi:hypothetical protein
VSIVESDCSQHVNSFMLIICLSPNSILTDFLRGVTYSATNDPLLQKIYEKEGVEKDDAPRPVDPRQELFAAIKSRRQG